MRHIAMYLQDRLGAGISMRLCASPHGGIRQPAFASLDEKTQVGIMAPVLSLARPIFSLPDCHSDNHKRSEFK